MYWFAATPLAHTKRAGRQGACDVEKVAEGGATTVDLELAVSEEGRPRRGV